MANKSVYNLRQLQQRFCHLLQTYSPEASSHVITMASNAFLRYYGNYAVAHEIALAVAMPDELMRIRNAGKKCQEVYLNAQKAFRSWFGKAMEDILALKQLFYEQAEKKDLYTSGIDRMTLQCIERGISTQERFTAGAAMYLGFPRKYSWDGNEQILGKTYAALLKRAYPETENPYDYILLYYDNQYSLLPTSTRMFHGVDDQKDREDLLNRIKDEGYSCAISGPVQGLPIRIVACNKKTKEEAKNEKL